MSGDETSENLSRSVFRGSFDLPALCLLDAGSSHEMSEKILHIRANRTYKETGARLLTTMTKRQAALEKVGWTRETDQELCSQ